jgi:hypothetical protein
MSRGELCVDLSQCKGFLRIDKALVFGGAFHGLSAVALQTYLALAAKCFEEPTEAMKAKGILPRQCAVSHRWLSRTVPGKVPGQGASRAALRRALAQLVASGLVDRRRGGPSRQDRTQYLLRTADQWRRWKASARRPAALKPNPVDSAERQRPRRRLTLPSDFLRPVSPPLTPEQYEAKRQKLIADAQALRRRCQAAQAARSRDVAAVEPASPAEPVDPPANAQGLVDESPGRVSGVVDEP